MGADQKGRIEADVGDACRVVIRSGHAQLLLKRLKDKIILELEGLTYALGEWEQLEHYLLEARLDIDHNAMEAGRRKQTTAAWRASEAS